MSSQIIAHILSYFFILSRNSSVGVVRRLTWELRVVKYKCVTEVQFNDCVLKQLHVSAYDGHRQVALGENLRTYYSKLKFSPKAT